MSTADTIAAISVVARSDTRAALLDLLIRFGELEAGVVDALSPGPDTVTVECQAFRSAATALGRLFYRSQVGQPLSMQEFRTLFERIRELPLPPRLRISVPEGYAFYGLYPETYIDAARRFAAECRPQNVCVIGLRSIGASLSAVVAGTLEELGCSTRSYTVRPQGHPFNRNLNLASPLPDGSQFYAIVDEGPGLSGSSLVCVADSLPADRVVLFPSWAGDAGRLLNERAREAWPSFRKFYGTFDPAWICRDEPFLDLCGGRWRGGENDIAVNPQHEARKYLAGLTLHKFAGLGSYGEAKFERAKILAEDGYSPPAKSLDRGFIAFDFVSRTPKSPRSSEISNHLADYLSFRRRAFPAERSVSFDEMREMIAVNTGTSADFEGCRREFEDRPAVAVDGRMMPHEWIATAHGWMKTDSVDHCCDHFYPGYADIVWDLAGAAVEFRMTSEERENMLSRYTSISGDRISPALIVFYETAYLAFRLGYTTMARDATAGTPDHERFNVLERSYSRRVRAATRQFLERVRA